MDVRVFWRIDCYPDDSGGILHFPTAWFPGRMALVNLCFNLCAETGVKQIDTHRAMSVKKIYNPALWSWLLFIK
jgi:hypothetical protein